ncbi:hypothetical protein PS3A_13020 [Pseudomonas sp. 3A(2025)]
MQTTQHDKRCPVFIHPAATNPRTIEAIQRATGLVVIISTKRRAALTATTTPWGGDAA